MKPLIWTFSLISTAAWTADRAFASFADGIVSTQELLLMAVAAAMAIGWLCLVPNVGGGDR